MIKHRARVRNSEWRYDPETGFLRCTAAILKAGIMEYAPHELPDMPEGMMLARVYVSPEELECAVSVGSLEGMPVVIGHIWQTTGTRGTGSGNVAGAPYCEAGVLYADLLVTDPEAVRRIMLQEGDAEKLVEISSAFDALVTWAPGITPEGIAFDGIFTQIRYNHAALLPIGTGRAGATIRIINQSEVTKMDFTRVKLRSGKAVRVANEDVAELERDMEATADEVAAAVDPAKLEETLAALETAKAERDEAQKKVDELSGSLDALKAQLETALSEETVVAAAEEMANERDEAEKVLVANGIGASVDVKKLRGLPLKVAVVNSVRKATGKAELSAEQAAKADYVGGMFATMCESNGTRAPAGHKAAHVENAQVQQPKSAFDRAYGKKEK